MPATTIIKYLLYAMMVLSAIPIILIFITDVIGEDDD